MSLEKYKSIGREWKKGSQHRIYFDILGILKKLDDIGCPPIKEPLLKTLCSFSDKKIYFDIKEGKWFSDLPEEIFHFFFLSIASLSELDTSKEESSPITERNVDSYIAQHRIIKASHMQPSLTVH